MRLNQPIERTDGFSVAASLILRNRFLQLQRQWLPCGHQGKKKTNVIFAWLARTQYYDGDAWVLTLAMSRTICGLFANFRAAALSLHRSVSDTKGNARRRAPTVCKVQDGHRTNSESLLIRYKKHGEKGMSPRLTNSSSKRPSRRKDTPNSFDHLLPLILLRDVA